VWWSLEKLQGQLVQQEQKCIEAAVTFGGARVSVRFYFKNLSSGGSFL
jgi:hypothetical protein